MQSSCPEQLHCGGQHNYSVKSWLCCDDQVTREQMQADFCAGRSTIVILYRNCSDTVRSIGCGGSHTWTQSVAKKLSAAAVTHIHRRHVNATPLIREKPVCNKLAFDRKALAGLCVPWPVEGPRLHKRTEGQTCFSDQFCTPVLGDVV